MSESAGADETGNVLVERAPVVARDSAPSISGEVNRYPGSPPFGDTEVDRLLFRGRASETDEVLHSILSYDLFLVYAVSGMGKTSLLTAGVLEPLRQRGYFPVIVRLNSPTTGFLALIQAQIHQAGEAAGVEIAHAGPIGAVTTTPETVWDLLAELQAWRGNDLQQLVLVFDQFEELFTLPWTGEQRSAFITQFGEVIRRHRLPSGNGDASRQALPPPNVKVVLCMREDFIGQLEELAVSVPQILNRRFRLGALTPEQAETAIRDPAALDDPRLRTQRFSYSAGAATTILTFLRTKDERGKSVLTDAIDPSQLQIICQHVERSILPTKAAGPDGAVEITEADLGGQDGLRRIVGDFYRRVLEEFQPKERKAIRHLCETGLISQTGRRLSQEEGEIYNHFEVTSDTLRKLVDLRLLRSEPRVGSVYYELAHDTLTGPILAYRDVQRRGRRRRFAIAGIVVAVLALLVLALVFARGNDHENAAGAAPTVIAAGDSVDGEIRSSADRAVFEVSAAEQPVLVEVQPSGFDASLDVAAIGSGDESIPETVDEYRTDASEFAVIAPGTGVQRVTVGGRGSGEFRLLARLVNPRPVDVPGRLAGMKFATSGEPLLLQVRSADDTAFVVTASSASSSTALTLTINGPARSTSLTSVSAQPSLATITAGGAPGVYTVVVRGGSGGDSNGTVDVTVRRADVLPAPVGEVTEFSFGDTEREHVLEVRLDDDRLLFLNLQDDQSSATGQILTPDGEVVPLDAWSDVALRNGAGRYLVLLTSDWEGVASLSVSASDVRPVELGDVVHGELNAQQAAAIFEVEAPSNGQLLAEVISDETLDAVLGLVGADGQLVEPIDFAAEGAIEQLVLPSGSPGSMLLSVSRFGDTSGNFTFSVRPATIAELAIGDNTSGHLESAQVAPLKIIREGTEPFALTVTTSAGFDASVGVTAPDGSAFEAEVGSSLLIDGAVPGDYLIEIRSLNSAGDFDVAVRRLQVATVSENAPVRAQLAGTNEATVFDLEIAPGSTSVATISAESDGLAADASINDSTGFPIQSLAVPAGGSASLLLADDTDHQRLVVTSTAGSGTVAVTVRAIAPIDLEVGKQTSLPAGESGDVALLRVDPGTMAVLKFVPSSGVSIDTSVVGQFGSVLFPSAGATSGDQSVILDGRLGPVLVLVHVDEGPGELRIDPEPIEPVEASVGAPIQGAIAQPGDVAVYEFNVADAPQLDIRLRPSGGLKPHLVVFDPTGLVIADSSWSADPTWVVAPLFQPGRYRLAVSGVDGTTGGFDVVTSFNTSLDGPLPPLVLPDQMLDAVAENLTE
jgi:hypothetical protein